MRSLTGLLSCTSKVRENESEISAFDLKFQDAETSGGVDVDVARFEPKLQRAASSTAGDFHVT